MGYFFPASEQTYANSNYNNCLSLIDIQNGNGSVVENKDGTVSVYMPSGPIFLRNDCCERLKPNSNYYFDLNTQKCRWTANSDTCGLDNIKVTLNPDGNDGTIFYTDSVDETCSLIIDFDYLFKVSCESLTTIMNNSDKTKEQLDAEKKVRDIQIEITKKTSDCEAITKQITELNKQIDATSYSIQCSHNTATVPPNVGGWNGINNFGNTGFSPFGFPSNYSGAILCLTDAGINVWQNILSTDNYNSFINGDPTSYTCNDVNNIKSQNDEIVKSNTINNTNTLELFFQCTTPFGTKTQLLKQLDGLNANQTTCQSELTALNVKLTAEQTKLLQLQPLTCANPIDTFETLSISISLEVEDSFNNIRTVATYPLLSPIGVGNLYAYLADNADNSGFLVCGEPNTKELAKGITGCTPMHLNASKDVFACSGLLEHMLDELYVESELTDKKEFIKTLDNNVFSSKFLHHNTVIDDQTIISDIINKKVKLSVRINHSCSDFCVLMDNIQLNKSCQLVTEKKMFIAQPPSFDLERVIDNKKSWVANTSFENRTFNIRNEVNTNPIRLTDYDVNDDRLVINTKEIDLDISIASAIETDVWCYIVDNPCLLTATTETTNCCEGCCSGETSVNFSELMTQPLSAVTTIEDFQYYISSELIDAKSRKVLSGYPTLRALYDRYTNSNNYCPTTSSAFNYENMDQFAHLIDSYWVDIVEQVVPATTIWGSVKIYGNTMFDQQKFQYKKGSLFTCTNEMSCNGLDDINACLFNIIDTYYTNEEKGCHDYACYQKGFGTIDFLDDIDQMPTSDQLRSFGASLCGCDYTLGGINSISNNLNNLSSSLDDFRGDNRDVFRVQVTEYSEQLSHGFCDGTAGVVTPDPSLVDFASFPNQFFFLGKPVRLKMNSGAKANVTIGWTANTDPTHGKTLQQIYSAYTNDFNFINSVATVGNLPITGNGGDLIKVGTPASYVGYAWDPIDNVWSSTMYDFIDSDILSDRRYVIDAHIKAKNELILAMRPFTWSNYHLLLHPIKLWALPNVPIVTGNEIINSETDITPCSYEQIGEPCDILPFCGPNKHIDNTQC
jgi:hypothetical protein